MSEDAIQTEPHVQDEAGWQQLAADAAEWPADHEGLQALRQSHVNRLLGEKGLGHLVDKSESSETEPDADLFQMSNDELAGLAEPIVAAIKQHDPHKPSELPSYGAREAKILLLSGSLGARRVKLGFNLTQTRQFFEQQSRSPIKLGTAFEPAAFSDATLGRENVSTYSSLLPAVQCGWFDKSSLGSDFYKQLVSKKTSAGRADSFLPYLRNVKVTDIPASYNERERYQLVAANPQSFDMSTLNESELQRIMKLGAGPKMLAESTEENDVLSSLSFKGFDKDALLSFLDSHRPSDRPARGYEGDEKSLKRIIEPQDDFKKLLDHRDMFTNVSDEDFAKTLIDWGALSLLDPASLERLKIDPETAAAAICDSEWFRIWSQVSSYRVDQADREMISKELETSGLMPEMVRRIDPEDLFNDTWALPAAIDQRTAEALVARGLGMGLIRTIKNEYENHFQSSVKEKVFLNKQTLETMLDSGTYHDAYDVICLLNWETVGWQADGSLDYHGASGSSHEGPVSTIQVDPEFAVDGLVVDKLASRGVPYEILSKLRSYMDTTDAALMPALIHAYISSIQDMGEINGFIQEYGLKSMPGNVIPVLLSKGFTEYELSERLHLFEDIDDATLERLRQVTGKDYLREYPRNASEKIRDRWFGEMSYAYLEGGFNKASIGHVIRLRLENENVPEHTIHDASQWLAEFGIPEQAYDVQGIMRQRDTEGFDPESIAPVKLRDTETEREFFEQLATLPLKDRQRLNISGKDGVAEQMFYQPEHQLLYSVALAQMDGVPYYKSDTFTLDELFQRAQAAAEDFRQTTAFGQGKEETTHSLDTANLQERLRHTQGRLVQLNAAETLEAIGSSNLGSGLSEASLKKLEQVVQDTVPTARQVSHTVGDLKTLGQARRAYVQDTQRWLERHALTPHARLTKVWGDRGLALAYGASDSSVGIEAWQTQNAFRMTAKQLDETGALFGKYGLTMDDVKEPRSVSDVAELSRHLSAANSLEALGKMKRWREARNWGEKLLPSAKLEVKFGDVETAKAYRFEVLDKDDPRGFTIGEDTGCCMTIHGESNSCIKAGYKQQNAGFVAIYAPDGRLAAQSFWYVNPSNPDTLVLDNIEANEGRDLSKVLEIYRQALTSYLTDNSALGIKTVHIGTGYSDVDLGGLKKVSAVPPVTSYSDAHTQRLLLELSA